MQQNNNSDAILLAVFGGACVTALLILAAYIFYVASLVKCFRRISRRNRRMDPSQVWLNLIPFFNTVWMPVTLDRLTDSLRDEFDDLRLGRAGDNFGRTLWVAYLTLFACAMIPYLGVFPGFVGLVVWVVYWVRIAAYSRHLAEHSAGSDDPRDERDYDDDPDRPRRLDEDD